MDMQRTMRLAGVLLASLTTAAVLGGSLDAVAQGVPVDQATEEQKAAARENFTKGKEAFDAKKYDEALVALRASYDVVASPNSRILIAQCLDGLGKPAEAFAEADAVATQAQAAAATDAKYEETAKAAVALRDALRTKVGLVTVRITGTPAPDATLNVGGRDIPRAEWERPIAVTPGAVTVTLSGSPSQQADVAAGAEASVEVGAAPPPPPPPPPDDEVEVSSSDNWFMQNRLPIGIAAGGVGVAGMLLFGIFGGMASSTYSDLEDQCTNGACPADLEGDADDGRTYQTVANVSLVIGIVGVAAGAGLIVWDLLDPVTSEEGDEGDEATAEATAAIRPQLVVGPGAIGLRGTF
jgi:hypothetical protein